MSWKISFLKDGRDGRDGGGIKVGLFKLQTLFSVFAWKVQKFKLNDPWSCMSPIKWSLFIVLNTGKDGRDGRDGGGIQVGLFKLQTLFSVFAWKVQKFKLNDPWSCMSPIKWSLLCECIKLPKKRFFWTFGLFSFQRKKNKIWNYF